MPQYRLPNDLVATVTIKSVDHTGRYQPLPAGDEFHLTNSDEAALSATIGVDHAGMPALVLRALKPEAESVALLLTDSAGMVALTLEVEITGATHQINTLEVDLLNVRTTPQPPPTPPKPAIEPEAEPAQPAAA
jgi:hypothetical protein